MAKITNAKQPDSALVDEAIRQIGSGNDAWLQTLYNEVSSSIYAYALSVTKSVHDAQDVMHDTFIKVYESAHTYKSHGKPMAWILTIAKNLCFQKFRGNARFVDIPDEALEGQFSANPNMSVEDKLFIKQYLSRLTEEERTIVVMHAMTGLKHREIAKVLQMPLATVLSKYNRAIKKLKKIIKGDGL